MSSFSLLFRGRRVGRSRTDALAKATEGLSRARRASWFVLGEIAVVAKGRGFDVLFGMGVCPDEGKLVGLDHMRRRGIAAVDLVLLLEQFL